MHLTVALFRVSENKNNFIKNIFLLRTMCYKIHEIFLKKNENSCCKNEILVA